MLSHAMSVLLHANFFVHKNLWLWRTAITWLFPLLL